MAVAGKPPAMLRGPGGVGTGVGIDWGLTVQFVTMALIELVRAGRSFPKIPPGWGGELPGAPQIIISILVINFVIAGLFFVLGDRLRRGSYTAWRLQVGFASLLLVVGVYQLTRIVHDLQVGQRPAIISGVVLLGVNPVALWLLAQPRTRAWFRAIAPGAAAERHGARWMAEIAAFALVGGEAVALGL
jgi:hypothetical protein